VTPAQLSSTVLRTVRRAVEAGELCVPVPERVVVRHPPHPGCGDYATNVALQLAVGAGRGGRGALEIAETLRRRLVGVPGIVRVEVAGPGFLNIALDAGSHARLVRAVLAQGEEYGRGEGLVGVRVRLVPEESGRPVGGGEPRGVLVAQVVMRLIRACGGGEGGRAEVLRVRGAGLTAEELLRLLGPDAGRWALLRAPVDEAPDLDPGRLLVQRESNPLFRVQYAHVRSRALLRYARDLGIPGYVGTVGDGGSVRRSVSGGGAADDRSSGGEGLEPAYGHPAETALIALLADHPRVLEAAADRRAPDRLARHLEATADAFLRFHDACPALPRGPEKPSAVHRSRLDLAEAAGAVLAGGLHLLGIDAPAHL
jgi:arginyl-tRNA synthetase